MVIGDTAISQERDVSRTPEPSNRLSNSRTGDGRYARGNPGGPGRPRGAVRGAASARLAKLASLARNRVRFSRIAVSGDSSRATFFVKG
jgi:hypothetical protein